MKRTVLGPCIVNGETFPVEADRDACPVTHPDFTCVAGVRTFVPEAGA